MVNTENSIPIQEAPLAVQVPIAPVKKKFPLRTLVLIFFGFIFLLIVLSVVMAGKNRTSTAAETDVPSRVSNTQGAAPPPALDTGIYRQMVTQISQTPTPMPKTSVLHGFVTVPPTAVATSGGIAAAPMPTDPVAYKELVSLLARNTTYGDTFTIQPMPDQNRVVISVDAPLSDNIQYAQGWLQRNGYGQIPAQNITYQER